MILDYLIHKLTENNPPEFNKDKCINSLVKTNNCYICKDSCPENAITIKDNKVIFDERKCNRCGICISKCPTQSIRIKGIGEDEIFFNASEKKEIVFACSLMDSTGNLNISCLNALHSELLSSLFILYKDKKFNFNLSKCTKCKFGYDNTLFKDSLNKAIKFVNTLGINPVYEIHTEEDGLSVLITEEISRRNLFKLVKRESSNVVAKTVNIIIDDKDNRLSYRNILLNAIKGVKLKDEKNNHDIFWEYWDVNIDCDGCGKCVSSCPGKAWKTEKSDTTIKVYHKFSNCYKCGLCVKVCPKKSISKGTINDFEFLEYNLKREIKLKTCKVCDKKFIYGDNEDDLCDICKKKEILRRRITTSI